MNDPSTIAKLLRAIAGAANAKTAGHDIILLAAADMLTTQLLPDGRNRLVQENSLIASQLSNCRKEIKQLREALLAGPTHRLSNA